MNNPDYSLKVINLSGTASITGRLIKVNPSRSNSFTLLDKNETNMLGVIVEGGVSNGQPCGIRVNGGAHVFVNGVAKQGDTIRSLKTGDSGSKGTAMVVKSSDTAYLKIGIALENGSNRLLMVALNPEYIYRTGDVAWADITGTPTTIAGYGITDHEHMGGLTDYTDFDLTGHMSMYGDARPWRDELGDALGLQSNGPGVSVNLDELTQDFAYNATYHATPALADFLYKNQQLNHDKDLIVPLSPHIHWFQAKNYSPNFLLHYRWQINGGAKTTAWTFLKCNNLAFPYTGGTIHQISYSSQILAPVGANLSDIVQFRIYRDAPNASLQFTGVCPYNTGGNATAGVLSFDSHIQTNSLGSTDELTK